MNERLSGDDTIELVVMPPTTLMSMKDELVALYAEDQVKSLIMRVGSYKLWDWIGDRKIRIDQNLNFVLGRSESSVTWVDPKMTVEDVLVQCSPEHQNNNRVRARSIVFAYVLWESVYRPTIGCECGVNRVESDAFGDLRHYRNAILHNKGKLDTAPKVLTVFEKSDVIEPSSAQLSEVFKQLVAALNDIGITYYGVNPDFKWSYKIRAKWPDG